MLTQLLYVSESRIDPESPTLFDEVTNILSSSFSSNQRAGISGVLLYAGGYFCQLLEGEESAVEERLSVIKADPRHTNMTVIFRKPISFRNIPKFPMGCAGIERKPEPVLVDAYIQREAKDPEAAAALLQYLLFSRMPTSDVVMKDPGSMWRALGEAGRETQ